MPHARLPLAISSAALACALALSAAPALAADSGADSGMSDADMADSAVITVTGERSDYRPEEAAATRTGTPLIDVPQSVSLLSRQQIDDQGLAQLNEALRFVPGVILNAGEGNRDQVALRGQSSSADFYLDGLRDDAQYYRALYNVERVEVLKGANALLFGRGGGGGVINRVSKSPQFGASQGSASGGVDSFGAWSLAADVNQPLSDAAALRINGTYEKFANHRDWFGGHFIGMAPTLGLKLGADTRVSLAYDYAADSRVADRGVPSRGGAPISGYDRSFFGDPAINRSAVKSHIARARIEHDLAPGLTANFTAQYNHADKYYGNILPGAATAKAVSLTGYASQTLRESWIGQGNLVWKAGSGALRHTLLMGFEAARQDSQTTRRDALFAVPGGGTSATGSAALAQSLILPVITWTPINRSTTSQVTALSAYVQDQLELGDHVQLVGGLRYDQFQITSLNRINQFAATRRDGKWSPRLGVILKPVANVSLYASYARSFLPQSGDQFAVLDATTATLAPEAFRNLETGVKWDLRPGLSFTAALFQLDRSNTRSTDPLTGNPLLTGASRVRGFEAALAGRLTPRWQASLGFARQTGSILSSTLSGSTTIPAGRALPQLPKAQITGWTRYDLTRRFGLGLGLVHQSSQFASISNAVRLPGFTRLDASAYLDLSKAVSLQLNIENVTDARTYPSANSDNNIQTGEPINARLTARVKF